MRNRASAILPAIVVVFALGAAAVIWPRWLTPLLVAMPIAMAVGLLFALYLDRTGSYTSARGADSGSGLRPRWKLRLALILVGLAMLAAMTVLILTQAPDMAPAFFTS